MSAVSVAANSDNVKVKGVSLKMQETLYPLAMRHVNLAGSSARLSDLTVNRKSGQPDISQGLVISGSNALIEKDVIPRYATSRLLDTAQTTQYAMEYGKTITISGGGSHTFDCYPVRGMTVGSVRAYVVGGTVTDHVYTVGRAGSNTSLLAARPVATETLAPTSDQLDPGFPIQSFVNTSGGTVTLNVTISGVPLV